MIFDAHTLAKCAQNSIIIDLASYPGGVDFEADSRLKIKSIHALSLPGKIAPKTAGAIIKSTIYDIINEEAINE
jgi:dipicolinate synthase subunit A